jgi:uncharacterized protein (PEP-CTERM system associated)
VRGIKLSLDRIRLLFFVAPIVLVGAFSASKLEAGEYVRTSDLTLGSYYSTNICRTNTDEQSKVVGTATPRISIRGRGGSSSVALRARAQYNSLGDSDLVCEGGFGFNQQNREAWVPAGNFFGTFDLVENWVTLEADAFAGQNPFDPFRAGGDDNLSGLDNTNITYRWGVGARVDRQFADRWGLFARYNYNEQYNSRNRAIGDSKADEVQLNVGMLPGSARFVTGLQGQYTEVQFEPTLTSPAGTNRLSRLAIRNALAIDRTFSLDASFGVEDNIFVSTSDEIDGSFWDAGFSWQPNARVSVSAGYGERFFGEAPRFNINYRHKRSTLRAFYLRDIRFPRNIRADSSDFDPDRFLDDPASEVPGGLIDDDGQQTFTGGSPVLDERFVLRYTLTGNRTQFTLSATDSRQNQVAIDREGTFQTVVSVLSRDVSPKLTASLRLSWRKNETERLSGGANLPRDLERRRISIGLSRRLSNDASVTVRYSFSDQVSASPRNEFEEHRIALFFSISV